MPWDRDKEKKAGKALHIGSCIFGILFVIVWCGLAVSIGASVMLLFGIPFLGLMVYRLYVLIQLSHDGNPSRQEEETPLDRPAEQASKEEPAFTSSGRFCPYCGSGVQETFEFCPACGRRLS